MLVGQAHSFTQQARLAITLAWVAGFTNTITLAIFGRATSHSSGTISDFGRRLGGGDWGAALLPAFLVLMFILGAVLTSFCLETGRRRGWESIYVLPITIEAALLATLAIGVEFCDPGSISSTSMLYLMTGLASLAMGLQNATTTRISGGVVRTTHMTGVVTDLGLEGVQLLFWVRDRVRERAFASMSSGLLGLRSTPAAKRLFLLASLIGSFALGAALSVIVYQHWPRLAMAPPVAFLIWIIVQDLRVPICEIEESVTYAGVVGLPDGLAVYHVKRDSDRSGRVHRLPDLLRWCERLPMTKRVVILDLADVSDWDANAALELRALINQATGRGRRLIFAGVDVDRVRNLKAAGAGDALDAENVFPDLELAIASGLSSLEVRGG